MKWTVVVKFDEKVYLLTAMNVYILGQKVRVDFYRPQLTGADRSRGD